MHQADYRLIANHELRNIMRSCCNDPRDLPGRKALRAQLVEALPDAEDDVIDALVQKGAELAQRCVDPGARWDARASADALTLHVLKTYEASDLLVSSDEDTTPEDVSAALAAIDNYDPTQRNVRAVVNAAKAAELNANAIRHSGGQ